MVAEVDENHSHAGRFQLLDRLAVGARAMAAAQGHDRQVRVYRQGLFHTEGFGGGAAYQRYVVGFGKVLLERGVTLHVQAAKIPLPAGDAGKRVLAFKERQRVDHPAFTQQDMRDLVRYVDLAPRQVGDGVGAGQAAH